MKGIFNNVQKSVEHLKIIEDVLSTDQTYQGHVSKYNKDIPPSFTSIFYSKEGFDNQMPLADLLEYILFGRSYHLAKNQKSFDNFYKILVRTANLIFLHDSLLANDPTYRKKLIKKLANQGHLDINSDEAKFLLKFEDSLTPDQNYGKSKEEKRKKAYKILDGLLPKVLGTPNEIIAYIHLVRKRIGYVIPLLLHQKLLRGKIDRGEMSKKKFSGDYQDILDKTIPEIKEILNEYGIDKKRLLDKELEGKNRKGIKKHLEKLRSENIEWISPPDYLVITPERSTFGVEVGYFKDRQGNEFSSATGIPVLSTFGDLACSYRCPKCHKWILFSDFVIDKGMSEEYRSLNKIYFDDVPKKYRDYSQGVCYKENRHYHYECIKDDYDLKDEDVFYYFPYVEGLEQFES